MKRIGNLWPQFISFDNLLLAYLKARLGKQNRPAVAAFSFQLEYELFRLQAELESGNYQHGDYRQFIIRERKPRLISAAPFRDRVVHHALMNVLEPIFEARFYYHSYACRLGKGTHKAVDQYQAWATRYPYVLKLDIARYFPSIRHDVLKAQYRRMVKDTRVLAVMDHVVDSSPADIHLLECNGVGLPIGNLTSQYFANLYLNDIDHWHCSVREVKAYLRYVDDLSIFGESKPGLWNVRDQLVEKLSEIGLSLHARKQTVWPTSERVDVLGYKVSRHRRWLRNDNGYRMQRKLEKWNKRSITNQKAIQASKQAWIGHAMHGETHSLRQHLGVGTFWK